MLPEIQWYGHGVTIVCDIWSTLGDERHGGESLPTNEDACHVQGEVMINMVGCLEPMVNF